MNFLKSKKRGFTLVELLVVISIVSLLASISLTYLNTARAKSRDAKRLRDLTEMRKALQMYWNQNGSFPSTGGQYWANCNSGAGGMTRDYDDWIRNGAGGFTPTFIASLPNDPKPGADGTRNCYQYRSNGTNYILFANRTVESVPAANIPTSLCRPSVCGTGATYAVYSDRTAVASW